MANMFAYTPYLVSLDVSGFDTSNVENMSSLFLTTGGAQGESDYHIIGLNNWDVSNVTNMNEMFYDAGSRATNWSIGDLSSWNVSGVTNMSSMFAYAGYSATNWSIGDLSSWDVSKVKTMSHMFTTAAHNAGTFNLGNLQNWNTAAVIDMSYMFSEAGYNATTWNIGSLKTYAISVSSMFANTPRANATLNVYNKPTSFSNMFQFAATVSGKKITVNYRSVVTNINNLIATKSSNSKVVKGSVIT